MKTVPVGGLLVDVCLGETCAGSAAAAAAVAVAVAVVVAVDRPARKHKSQSQKKNKQNSRDCIVSLACIDKVLHMQLELPTSWN